MYSQSLMFWSMILWIDASQPNKPITLNIGALFNSEHRLDSHGQQDLQAAQMAIDEINLRYRDLFHGRYVLTLLSNNSRCDPVYAVDAFFHAIFRRPQLLFLVGTSCSNETKAVIQVADYYNLILFSHSTSFISQANQTSSTLVRLSVSDENYNDARVAFIKSNNWSHVAIIHQDSTEHSLMMAQLAKRLNESDINIILTQSASMTNLTSALRTLREKKARIVFVHFDTLSRAIFFCEVYRTFTKALRERYVWILTGNDYHLWTFSLNNCTRREIMDAARGHIIIDSSYEIKSSPINPNTTVQQLQQRLLLKDHLDRQTLQAYDAIWVIALLIRISIEQNIPIEQFTYSTMDVRDQWLTLLEQIYFLGVSGPVSFRNNQRRAETLISQFRVNITQYRVQTIAEYSHGLGLNTSCSACRTLIWLGAMPVDTERIEVRRLEMSIIEIALVTSSCMLALALAIFFLTFNILHRHERYIKLSSPKLNNVMVLGAIHIHICILLFGLDTWFLNSRFLKYACMLRIFLFSGGFSLTFGSMFLKTLRVYRIFTSRNRPLLHSKLLQDHHLLLVCLYLYGIDLLFAIIWEIFDPHSVQFTQGPIRPLNIDIGVIDEIYYCDSRYRQKILPFVYLYKSLFLVIGGYLAAKTRHVHIAALNDSKFIVWSIYVVVLTSVFTFIVMISLKNLRIYVAICLVVIIMTSSILCLVFLPKVIRLKNRHLALHEVVSKDLVVDDSRTRRLVIEISYFEKYRYAQLQNRELKTELIRLNHILNALEQKLEAVPSSMALALLPIAVRWASTFLQIPEIPSVMTGSNSKVNVEPIVSPTEQVHFFDNDSISSDNTLFHFDQTLSSSSSSSELNLSLALQSINDLSSLSLSAFDDQTCVPSDDDDNTSLTTTPNQTTSDNESVLYLRLANELNIGHATLDSDLERLDRFYVCGILTSLLRQFDHQTATSSVEIPEFRVVGFVSMCPRHDNPKNSSKRNERDTRQQEKKSREKAPYLKYDKNTATFDNQLRAFNLQLRNIAGDGNCLFRSFADQMDGDQSRHDYYRKRICDFMRDNRTDFEPFIVDQPFDAFLQSLSKDGTFGGNECIVAFSRLFDARICIHQLNQPVWTVCFFDHPKHEIHISYHNYEHYSSVRKLGDSTSTSANIRQAMTTCDPSTIRDQKKKPTSEACAVDPEDLFDKYDVEYIQSQLTSSVDRQLIRDTLTDNHGDVYGTIAYLLALELPPSPPPAPEESIEKIMSVTGVYDVDLVQESLKNNDMKIDATIDTLMKLSTGDDEIISEEETSENESTTKKAPVKTPPASNRQLKIDRKKAKKQRSMEKHRARIIATAKKTPPKPVEEECGPSPDNEQEQVPPANMEFINI